MFHWLKNRAAAPGGRRRERSRLGVEALETRDCPSTTVALAGNTLNIVGDASADQVQIFLRDNVGDIQVMSNPRQIISPFGGSLTIWQINHFSSLQVQNIAIEQLSRSYCLTEECYRSRRSACAD